MKFKPSSFTSIRLGNHLYVYYKGTLIYKRWYKADSTEKSEPSMIFNEQWPNVKLR